MSLSQVVAGGTVIPGGNNAIQGNASMIVDVIADAHITFDPYELPQSSNLAGAPRNNPNQLVNAIRADNPAYIIFNGDGGHNSLPAEYNAVFVQSATAVTSTGVPTVISVNCSPSYSEYGMTPHQDLHLYGSSDTASNTLYNTSWVSVYDDNTGKNFEIVQASSVTNNTCPTSSTFTATFTKLHPVGFLMRDHALSEFWDYALQGKIVASLGNHDVNCKQSQAASTVYLASGCPGDPNGPQDFLTYLQFVMQNSSTFPFNGYSAVSPFGNYYARTLNPLLSVIAIDSMAGQYTGGGGTNYGQTQEATLRCALSAGTGAGCGGSGALASQWVITTQHYCPANSCTVAGIAPWAMNAGVDLSLCGHTHLDQEIFSPRCGGSGCTNVTGPGGATSIPVLDGSGYTWETDDPMNECIPLSPDCPGCTRPVLNSANLNTLNDGLGTLQISYIRLTITQHSLAWVAINNNGQVVKDFVTGALFQGVINK